MTSEWEEIAVIGQRMAKRRKKSKEGSKHGVNPGREQEHAVGCQIRENG